MQYGFTLVRIMKNIPSRFICELICELSACLTVFTEAENSGFFVVIFQLTEVMAIDDGPQAVMFVDLKVNLLKPIRFMVRNIGNLLQL